MNSSLIIVLSMTLIVIFVFLIMNNKKKLMCNAILFAFMFYYSIVPMVMLFSNSTNNSYGSKYVDADVFQILYAYFLIIIFVTIFLMSYRCSIRGFRRAYYFTIDEQKFIKVCKLVSKLTFIVGGFSFVLYIFAFHGIASMLLHAEYLRSNATTGSEFLPYWASILFVPSRLIIFTPISLIPVISHSKKKTWRILFAISFFLAVVFLLFNAGKAPIAAFGITFLYPILRKKSKHPWIVIILMVVVALPLLGIMDSLFLYFSTGYFPKAIIDIGNLFIGFAYPYSNAINVDNIVAINGFRFFRDFLTGVLNVLPGVSFSSSYEPTSFFYNGNNWRIIGGTPNDIITFSYLEGSLLGVLVISFLLGSICKRLDYLFRMTARDSALNYFIAVISVSLFLLIGSSDIHSIVQNQVFLTLGVLCIIVSSSYSTKCSYRCLVLTSNYD